jgi:hypothetical protein
LLELKYKDNYLQLSTLYNALNFCMHVHTLSVAYTKSFVINSCLE